MVHHMIQLVIKVVTCVSLIDLIACTYYRYANWHRPLNTTLQYSGSIAYLEHIVINMTLISHKNGSKRGHIRIKLTSPSGTSSTLLDYRLHDVYLSYHYSREMYKRWPFMSVMFWGENPRGQWTLSIESYSLETEIGMRDVVFQFYGTSEIPQAVRNIPDQCHSDCVRGCAAEGSMFCDACVNLRNAYTLECIESCPPGYTERNGYCYDLDEPLPVCNSRPSKSRGKVTSPCKYLHKHKAIGMYLREILEENNKYYINHVQ